MITITDPFTELGDFIVTLHDHPFGAVVLVALAWVAVAWVRSSKRDGIGIGADHR